MQDERRDASAQDDTAQPVAGGAAGGPADPFATNVRDVASPPGADEDPAAPGGDPSSDVDPPVGGRGPSPAGEGTPGDIGRDGGGSTEDPGRRDAIVPGEGRIGSDPEGHPPRD